MKNKTNNNRKLTKEQQEIIIDTLKKRFEKNMKRHKGILWEKIQTLLEANTEKLWSLHEMEKTGGEPDVVSYDKKSNTCIFYDCSEESPAGRRSVCYDMDALLSRKEHRPKNNAIDMAASIGGELLNEDEYRALQKLGEFDTKTSSWLKTPAEVRELGGAIFADFRFGRVFVYHNGAQSYYSGRAFRCSLKI